MHNFEYFINEKERAPGGQVYLGAFLAAALFFSFFFGSLLFFIIVLIICVFIFLDKDAKIGDEYGRIKVIFSDKYFSYGQEKYSYEICKSFTVHRELFGQEVLFLRISFKAGDKQDLFIYIPSEMHLKNVYDIIRQSVKENKGKSLTFTDQLFIRFF